MSIPPIHSRNVGIIPNTVKAIKDTNSGCSWFKSVALETSRWLSAYRKLKREKCQKPAVFKGFFEYLFNALGSTRKNLGIGWLYEINYILYNIYILSHTPYLTFFDSSFKKTRKDYLNNDIPTLQPYHCIEENIPVIVTQAVVVAFPEASRNCTLQKPKLTNNPKCGT